MRLMLALAVSAVLWLAPAPARAQDGDGEFDRLRSELTVRREAMAAMDRELAQTRAEKAAGFTHAVKSYHGSLVHFYDYQNALRGHAQSVLVWQLISSYVLLMVVVGVVGLGVLLSFREVSFALRAPATAVVPTAAAAPPSDGAAPPSDGAAASGPASPAAHVLNLSATSLQVTSAVTGVVILVISLAFLYLFIDRVLGLEPVDLVTAHEPAKIEKDANGASDDDGSKTESE